MTEGSRQGDILVVDDQAESRYSTAKILESAGYHVTAVSDYRDALTYLDSAEPCELLLTGIVMPQRINGCALARMARMRRNDLKVLYITGFDVPTGEADGKVLRRPIGDDQLLSEVEHALRGNLL